MVAALALSFSALGVERPARANMLNQLISQYCLAAVSEEVRASGKPAPAGMAQYTCDCVVEEITQRRSQEQAKATCKYRTAKKYNL